MNTNAPTSKPHIVGRSSLILTRVNGILPQMKRNERRRRDQTEPFPKQASFDEEIRLILHQTKYFSRA
jgi:hypothetical protein